LTVNKRDEGARVWLLCGVALAALFLLKNSGMIFQGAITGLGIFVAIYVLMLWFPVVRNLLFMFGGLADVAISFGIPFVISNLMGIKGGTMFIATLACGLLFTFSLATRRLGGIAPAGIESGRVLFSGVVSQYHAAKESLDGKLPEVGSRGSRSDHWSGSNGECPKSEETGEAGSQQVGRRNSPGRRLLTLGSDGVHR